MDNIKEHLTNHVTGTEKEIKELKIDMNAKFDKIDLKFDKIESTMNAKFDKVDSRLDSLFVILSKKPEDSDKK